ncbi:MAG: DUF4397 domain-containing protein [Chloroflexaceae bacterium]|nr:DUF4397 domain-containing protein [Chloroflexaceae bacterium]
MHRSAVSFFVLLTLIVSMFAMPVPAPTVAGPVAPAQELLTAAQAIVSEPVVTNATELQTVVEPESDAAIALKPAGTYQGEGAEIVAFDPETNRLFSTDAGNGRVDIIDASDINNLTLVSSINLREIDPVYGGDQPNSVAVKNGLVAVAVAPTDIYSEPGKVALFDTDGTPITAVTVGFLPDMVTFTPDGNTVLVANEGEPNDDYSIDPPGSVSIVDVTNVPTVTVQTVGFDLDPSTGGLTRVNPVSVDPEFSLEPEYITVSPDGSTAYVTLQEENAVAVIDIATATLLEVAGLGFKNHNVGETGLDASNRDGIINIQNWPVRGMYQPDAIASFEIGGETYLVTANEGDSRDYDGYSEEARIADLRLNPALFPNAEELQQDENLGRLLVTKSTAFLSDTAKVRLVHAHPDVPPVDITVLQDGTQIAGPLTLAFGDVSDYLELPGGTYQVVIAPQGLGISIPVTVDLFGGSFNTFTVFKNVGLPLNVDVRHFTDNPNAPESGNAKVNVYHLSETAGLVDVVANIDGVTETLVDDLPFVSDVTMAGELVRTPQIEVAEGTYDLAVTPADDDSVVALDLSGTELNDGDILSVFALDGNVYTPAITATTALTENITVSRLWPFGARSFTIWNSAGQLVYDSGNDFEIITAGIYPRYFNANYDEDEGFLFDERSDDKGPEPESVTIGTIGDNTYAFIGLERIGGIMVYNVTNPQNPRFIQYINNAELDGIIPNAGDVSIEGIIFVPAEESPSGTPLVVTANELSGTTTIFEVIDPNGAATLTVLHNNDGESSLLPLEADGIEYGGVAAFKSVFDREASEARDAGNAIAAVYAGDAFLASATIECSFPITGTTEPVYVCRCAEPDRLRRAYLWEPRVRLRP